MKKQIMRLIALLVFASVAISSCSIEYRQRHGHHHNGGDHQDHGDHEHNQNYRDYNH